MKTVFQGVDEPVSRQIDAPPGGKPGRFLVFELSYLQFVN